MAQAADIFRRVRAAFPGGNVSVSTFDEYTAQLVAAAPALDLPVFTQEIGDTWIYGERTKQTAAAGVQCATPCDFCRLSNLAVQGVALTRHSIRSECHHRLFHAHGTAPREPREAFIPVAG